MPLIFESLLIAFTATSVIIVEQLGLEIIPLFFLTSSALISGTTSGTSSHIRNALELSTNTAPAFTISGANSLAIAFEAAPRTISSPSNAPTSASLTSISCPLKEIFFPTLRALASKRSSPSGKFLSSSIFIISRPTAPVAPRIPTLYVFIILLPRLNCIVLLWFF